MAKLSLTDIAGGYGLVATYNANNDLIEAALENTLSLDGTSPNAMNANLDMNSKRVTNVSDPSGNQDAATKKYVDDSLTNLVIGEIDFSVGANYTITGAWTFEGNQNFEGNVVVTDGSGDDMTIFANGGFGDFSFNYDGSSGGDITFGGWDTVRLNDGCALYIRDDDNSHTVKLANDGSGLQFTSQAGSNEWRIDSTFATAFIDANLYIEDGHLFRVYDGGEDDFLYVQHNGANGIIGTAGTGAGAVDLLLDPGANSVLIGSASAGALKINEGAAAASDTAGYGQFWVKDDTPNIPKYTDDAGTDFTVGTQVTGSFTGTLTGCTTSPTSTFRYVIDYLDNGYKRVTIWNDVGLTATSNSTTCTITGVPAAIQPQSFVARGALLVYDNSVQELGTFFMSDGNPSVITLGFPASTDFTNSGLKGINEGCMIQYMTT